MLRAWDSLSSKFVKTESSFSLAVGAGSLSISRFPKEVKASLSVTNRQVGSLPLYPCFWHWARRGSCSPKAVASPWQELRADCNLKNLDHIRSSFWSTAWSAYLAPQLISKEKALVTNFRPTRQHSSSPIRNRTSMGPYVFLGVPESSCSNQSTATTLPHSYSQKASIFGKLIRGMKIPTVWNTLDLDDSEAEIWLDCQLMMQHWLSSCVIPWIKERKRPLGEVGAKHEFIWD